MNKKWECYSVDEDKVNELSKDYNLCKILANILVNRNIENIDKFLNPTRHDFHDPFLMPDMEKAIQRLIKAIEDKQKIMILEIMMQMELQV